MSDTVQEVEDLEVRAKQFDTLRAVIEPHVRDGESLYTCLSRLGEGTPPSERAKLELKASVRQELDDFMRINPSLTLQGAVTHLFAGYERALTELG